jgi:hypothetical protein
LVADELAVGEQKLDRTLAEQGWAPMLCPELRPSKKSWQIGPMERRRLSPSSSFER